MIVLETERLLLRPWRESDRLPMRGVLGDPEVRRFYPTTLTPEEADRAMDESIARAAAEGFHMQAAELKATGQTIGLIGLGHVSDSTRAALRGHPPVEIGWQFGRAAWGQGLAPEGARAWLDYGFDVLGLPEIVAFTYEGNLPSRRVMEKIGMVRDPADDFDHPRIAPGQPLRRHVLYRIGSRRG